MYLKKGVFVFFLFWGGGGGGGGEDPARASSDFLLAEMIDKNSKID